MTKLEIIAAITCARKSLEFESIPQRELRAMSKDALVVMLDDLGYDLAAKDEADAAPAEETEGYRADAEEEAAQGQPEEAGAASWDRNHERKQARLDFAAEAKEEKARLAAVLSEVVQEAEAPADEGFTPPAQEPSAEDEAAYAQQQAEEAPAEAPAEAAKEEEPEATQEEVQDYLNSEFALAFINAGGNQPRGICKALRIIAKAWDGSRKEFLLAAAASGLNTGNAAAEWQAARRK